MIFRRNSAVVFSHRHIMVKLIYIILAIIVICSQSILLARANTDDEFAEFDDIVPSETGQQDNLIREQSQQSTASVKSSPSPNREADNGNTKKSVDSDDKRQQKQPIDSGDDDDDDDHEEDVVRDDKTQKKPDLKLVNAPLPRIYKWESYYIEIAFLLASLLYFVNFFVGSSKNYSIAQQWYEQSKDLLKQQFALVGGAPQLNEGAKKGDEDGAPPAGTKRQRGLIKSTESMYTLWNSGRVGMDGLLIEINLLKRQDLFSMALNLLKPKKDTLILRFSLGQESYENFVFCLAHKTQAPKLAREMVDINTFCPKKKPVSQYGIDADRLFVMSELSDVTSFIMSDQKTVSFAQKFEQSINYIHITDQYSTLRSEELSPAQKLAQPKRMATFSFNFPRDSADREEFILFALSLLDRLRRFKLGRDSKQKSEKNRQKITDILQKSAFSQRQEAAQAKKEELRRQEKERIYNEDDPEKQRRWEAKEAKRELKKNKMRVKQLKVKSM